jgi:hypothetical protein
MNDTIENNPIITAKIKKIHGCAYDRRVIAQDLRQKRSAQVNDVTVTERIAWTTNRFPRR